MKDGAGMASVALWRSRIARRFDPLPDSLIPALQYVQQRSGFLSGEALTAVAQHLRIAEAKVFGVASFYSLFRLKPRGRNQITVCRGTACHVQGSATLLENLEKMLGTKAGGTTADKRFSLDTVGCLGTCALAIPIVINGNVYGRQTTASAKRLVKRILTAAPGTEKARAAGKAGRQKECAGRRKVKTDRRAV